MFRTKDHKIEKLANVSLFRRCDKKQLQSVASIVDEVEFGEGEVLFREGQTGRQAYVIVSGEVSIDVGGDVIAVVGEGETVGEMSLIDHSPRSATVTTRTPVQAYVISASNFIPMLADNPMVAVSIMENLSERIRALDSDHQRMVREFVQAPSS